MLNQIDNNRYLSYIWKKYVQRRRKKDNTNIDSDSEKILSKYQGLVFTLSCVYTYEFRLSIDILEINKYPYFDSVLFQLLRS